MRIRLWGGCVLLAGVIALAPAIDALAQSLPPITPTPAPTARPTAAPTRRPTARPTARATPRVTSSPSPTPSPTPTPAPTPTPRIIRIKTGRGGGTWFFVGLVVGGLLGRASMVWQRRIRRTRVPPR